MMRVWVTVSAGHTLYRTCLVWSCRLGSTAIVLATLLSLLTQSNRVSAYSSIEIVILMDDLSAFGAT